MQGLGVTHGGFLDGHQFVPHINPAVQVRGPPLHDLGDVYPVVPGDVLVADAPRDGEPQPLVALLEGHLQYRHVWGPLATLHALKIGRALGPEHTGHFV